MVAAGREDRLDLDAWNGLCAVERASERTGGGKVAVSGGSGGEALCCRGDTDGRKNREGPGTVESSLALGTVLGSFSGEAISWRSVASAVKLL